MDWHVLRPGALTPAEADRITRFMDRAQGYLAEEHPMCDPLSSADLDALIARRVMGWTETVPPYSTDWGAAGQVVDQLNRRDPPWRVQLIQLGYPPRTWQCTLFQGALSEGVTV